MSPGRLAISCRNDTPFIDAVLDFNQAGDSPGYDLTRYRAWIHSIRGAECVNARETDRCGGSIHVFRYLNPCSDCDSLKKRTPVYLRERITDLDKVYNQISRFSWLNAELINHYQTKNNYTQSCIKICHLNLFHRTAKFYYFILNSQINLLCLTVMKKIRFIPKFSPVYFWTHFLGERRTTMSPDGDKIRTCEV